MLSGKPRQRQSEVPSQYPREWRDPGEWEGEARVLAASRRISYAKHTIAMQELVLVDDSSRSWCGEDRVTFDA